jgi:hypothetical protein
LCSGQLGEQGLGLFQIRYVESSREPTVNRREQLTHRHDAPLVTQQTAEVQRCAHLPKLCVPSVCDIDGLAKARFGRGAITSVTQQRAAQSVALEVKLPLLDRFHHLPGFGQSLPRRSQLVRFAERVCNYARQYGRNILESVAPASFTPSVSASMLSCSFSNMAPHQPWEIWPAARCIGNPCSAARDISASLRRNTGKIGAGRYRPRSLAESIMESFAAKDDASLRHYLAKSMLSRRAKSCRVGEGAEHEPARQPTYVTDVTEFTIVALRRTTG